MICFRIRTSGAENKNSQKELVHVHLPTLPRAPWGHRYVKQILRHFQLMVYCFVENVVIHVSCIVSARYRQQIEQAQTYYRHAAHLVPYNGGIRHYIRADMRPRPFALLTLQDTSTIASLLSLVHCRTTVQPAGDPGGGEGK